ncbi:MAG TPA: hypothetical protein VGF75_07820 [Candidatus Saccharimonadales bacterium]|jgi:hypothetical protein
MSTSIKDTDKRENPNADSDRAVEIGDHWQVSTSNGWMLYRIIRDNNDLGIAMLSVNSWPNSYRIIVPPSELVVLWPKKTKEVNNI